MKKQTFLLSAGLSILLFVSACSSYSNSLSVTRSPSLDSTNTPTSLPPSPLAEDVLQILSVESFSSDAGEFYIFGEVHNTSDMVLRNIQLRVEVRDANGKSLLVDDNFVPVDGKRFFPMRWDLAPDGSSPFVFSLNLSGLRGIPTMFSVFVDSYEISETKRPDLFFEHVEFIDGGNGYLYLSGVLINPTSDWLIIRDFWGVLQDDSQTVLDVVRVVDYRKVLAPAGDRTGLDRTPFSVVFPLSPHHVSWRLWWNSDIWNEADAAPYLYPLQIEVTNFYRDAGGDVHLVGYVTNQGSETIQPVLLAGLYAADNTCLDAIQEQLPVPIQPGQTIPFDISSFRSVNRTNNLSQAARVQSYTVQPSSVNPPVFLYIPLTSPPTKLTRFKSTWVVEGFAQNASDKNLTYMATFIKVLDPAGNLIGFSPYYCYNVKTFAPGAGCEFEVYLFLDPTEDLANARLEVLLLGGYEP